MDRCEPFTLALPGPAKSVITILGRILCARGSPLEGDDKEGSGVFISDSGFRFSGNYKVVDEYTVRLTITSKPHFVPCNVIQRELESYLKSLWGAKMWDHSRQSHLRY